MPINFTGSANIFYKSPNEFKELVKNLSAKEVGIFPHYNFKDKVTSKNPIYSQFANTCSIICMNNTMVHLAPETREYSLLDKISEFAKQLKDKTGNLTAVILGGKSRENADSFNLFNDVANVLDKEGADISMVCGKKIDGPRDAMLKDKNNYFITSESNNELSKTIKNKRLTPEQLQNAFESYYDVVDISPNHKLLG